MYNGVDKAVERLYNILEKVLGEKIMEQIKELRRKINENVSKVIVGKEKATDMLIMTLICGGHVLIEDIPGTGKTTLVKAFAASMDCRFKRIQFTPDLMPGDVTGISFFNMKKNEFEFMAGPVFTNILLADEINRATPKTQSGLLECMEERQVTVDGNTYLLQAPFMVVATQNKIESAGVFMLPEAQLDRFFVRIPMGYPSMSDGVNILRRFVNDDPLSRTEAVVNANDIIKAQSEIKKVFVTDDVYRYIIALCEATRRHDAVTLGVSPRASLALMRAAQAYAAMDGRSYVIPDDVKECAPYVLSHRLVLKNTARFKSGADERVIKEILENVSAPTENIGGQL